MLSTSAAVSRVRREGEIEERVKLHGMLDMPLDMIFEICSFLHPVDLLYLSRTSKRLHQTFMSRHARCVWRAVLANAHGLPACPNDLSEPAYASLIFDQYCHVCSGDDGFTVHWQCRMRMCDNCLKIGEIDEYGLCEYEEEFGIELAGYVPARALAFWDGYISIVYYRYYKGEAFDFPSILRHTPIAERTAFLDKSRKFFGSRAEGEREIFNHLKDLQKTRMESILTQLQEAGYCDEVAHIGSDINEIPGVRGIDPLRPEAWDAMKARLFLYMQDLRKEHRQDTLIERLHELHGIVEELCPRSKFPTPLFIGSEMALRVSSVTQFLNPDVKTFHTQDLERAVRDALPEYLERRAQHSLEAFRMFLRHELALDASTDPLQLAVATWLSYHVLHPEKRSLFALMLPTTLEIIRDERIIPYLLRPEPALESTCLTKEDCELIRVHAFEHMDIEATEQWVHGQNLKDAAAIIALCGLDPRTATVIDMDDADREVRIVCTLDKNIAPIMRWRGALYHLRKLRGECKLQPMPMRRATANEIDVAKSLEATAEMLEQHAFEQREPKYGCAHCLKTRLHKEGITSHLERVHWITEPTNRDYIDASTIVRPPPSVYLIRTSGQSKLAKKYLEEGIGALFDFAEV